MPNFALLDQPCWETFFAPAERADAESLQDLSERISRHPHLSILLEAIPGFGVLLNPQRQILAANRRMLDLVGASCPKEILGRRFGEAIGCIHSAEAPSGCGTGRSCAFCGAGTAILESQQERIASWR